MHKQIERFFIYFLRPPARHDGGGGEEGSEGEEAERDEQGEGAEREEGGQRPGAAPVHLLLALALLVHVHRRGAAAWATEDRDLYSIIII